MDAIIAKIPIPVSGLMLALAAAGNLVLQYGTLYKDIFGLLSAVIFIALIAKMIIMPKSLAEGFENPLVASVMPTFSMGLMILSTYIKPYFFSAAYCLWLLGLTVHVGLVICFTRKYILKFDIKKVFPSYFIGYVGFACGSVTAPAFGLARWGQLLFWLSFTSYLILFPLILYRVIIIKKIPAAAKPTIVIFLAPPNLCLAGYMNSFQEKSMAIVGFLSTLSLIMCVSVMLYIPRILRLKFYPSYSALTFPFVIAAVAMKSTCAFLSERGAVFPLFIYYTKFLEIWAITMVLYVLIRYIAFLLVPDDYLI